MSIVFILLPSLLGLSNHCPKCTTIQWHPTNNLKGLTVNYLGGLVRIFANEIFFQQPSERIFFLFWQNLLKKFFLITWFYRENVNFFRVKLNELNFFFGCPLDEFFFSATLQMIFFRFAPRPPDDTWSSPKQPYQVNNLRFLQPFI